MYNIRVLACFCRFVLPGFGKQLTDNDADTSRAYAHRSHVSPPSRLIDSQTYMLCNRDNATLQSCESCQVELTHARSSQLVRRP